MASTKRKVEKWKSGNENSVDSAIGGVNNLKVSPAEKAIQNRQKMIDKWNESISSDKWAKSLLIHADIEFWKLRTIKGYEKNRNIPQSVIDIMTDYYRKLESLTGKIRLVSDIIINGDAPFEKPVHYPDMIVSQHVSQALTKFQKELYNKTSIDDIFEKITDYMVNNLAYLPKSESTEFLSFASIDYNEGWEGTPILDNIQYDESNNDNNFIYGITSGNVVDMKINISDVTKEQIEEYGNKLRLYARIKGSDAQANLGLAFKEQLDSIISTTFGGLPETFETMQIGNTATLENRDYKNLNMLVTTFFPFGEHTTYISQLYLKLSSE